MQPNLKSIMLTKHAALQIYGLGQTALTIARSNIVWSDRVRKNAEGMEHGLAETPVVNVSQLAKLLFVCRVNMHLGPNYSFM